MAAVAAISAPVTGLSRPAWASPRGDSRSRPAALRARSVLLIAAGIGAVVACWPRARQEARGPAVSFADPGDAEQPPQHTRHLVIQDALADGPPRPLIQTAPGAGGPSPLRELRRHGSGAVKALGGITKRCGFGAARAFCGISKGVRAARENRRFIEEGARQTLAGAKRGLLEQLRLPKRPGGGREVAATQAVPTPQLFAQSGALVPQGPPDFFLFIKDYTWSLRYRIARLADSVLDADSPLQLDWVKLKKPVRDPATLLTKPSDDLFDWETLAPAMHKGFKYNVLGTVGSSVEAVINFLDGKGPSFLVRPDSGFELVDRGEAEAASGKSKSSKAIVDTKSAPTDSGERNLHVTHCWVQCLGMPFLPVIQSISFYDAHQVVLQWQA